jgi:hypothetical protein
MSNPANNNVASEEIRGNESENEYRKDGELLEVLAIEELDCDGSSAEKIANYWEKKEEEKAVHLHEGCDEGCTHWAHDEDDEEEEYAHD